MGRVLIIGAGGVGTVVAHKVAQNPDVFTDIMIASRTKSKCDAVVKAIGNPNILTAQVRYIPLETTFLRRVPIGLQRFRERLL